MVPVSKIFLPLNTQGGNSQLHVIGSGMYTIFHQKIILNILDAALGSCYRLIDKVAVYNEENMFNLLLPKYHLKHGDLFITSKLAFISKYLGYKLLTETNCCCAMVKVPVTWIYN